MVAVLILIIGILAAVLFIAIQENSKLKNKPTGKLEENDIYMYCWNCNEPRNWIRCYGEDSKNIVCHQCNEKIMTITDYQRNDVIVAFKMKEE